jgi:hypothetical protein
MSSQVIFDSALQVERKWELDFWQAAAPQNLSVTFALGNPEGKDKLLEWQGYTRRPFQAVDQRLKFSTWLEKLQEIGGNIVTQEVKFKDLSNIAQEHELTIIASGKKELSQAFSKNHKYSIFEQPARALACFYVKNMTPAPGYSGVHANIFPGVGEYFTTPGLTLNGHCEMMLFEGVPQGPFDVWDKSMSANMILEKAFSLLRKYFPWEAERCQNLKLTDNKAILMGAFTPVIREPILTLENGHLILGMADAIVLNDPIAGQGANNAIKCAEIYSQKILEHKKQPFDSVWMQDTFSTYWKQCGEKATQWSNMLLLPPPPHVLDLLTFASDSQETANLLANGFDNPNSLFPWITNAKLTEEMMRKKMTDLEIVN